MRRLLLLIVLASAAVSPAAAQFFGGGGDSRWQTIGVGPLASRPAACKANKHVWICNGAGCGTNGEYHYCTAANTWTAPAAASVSPQKPNSVYAGPAVGDPANPTFRKLTAADLPNMPNAAIGTAAWRQVYESPDTLSHQGYATDGTYHYTIDTATIYKRHPTTWAVVATNATPFVGGTQSYTHLGDGAFYNGELFIAAQDNSVSPSIHPAILVYDSSLAFVREIKLPAGISADSVDIDPQAGKAYLASWTHGGDIQIFNFPAWTFDHTVTVNPALTAAQGTIVKNGIVYVMTEAGRMYSINLITGAPTLVFESPLFGQPGWHEGADWTQAELRWLYYLQAGPKFGTVFMFSNAALTVGYAGVTVQSDLTHAYTVAAPLIPANAAVPSTGWTWGNQGASTVTFTNDKMLLSSPVDTNLHVQYRTAPATPYTVRFVATEGPGDFTGEEMGVCFRESATGKYVSFGWGHSGGNGASVAIIKWTNATTQGANYVSESGTDAAVLFADHTQYKYLSLTNDGTNLVFKYSRDGEFWTQLFSVGKTDHFTAGPDEFGVYARAWTAPNVARLSLLGMW